MNTPHSLDRLLRCLAFAAFALGSMQACSDSSGNTVAHGGGSGVGGTGTSEGGTAPSASGAGGRANGGSGTAGNASAGASGNADDGGSGAEAGANGSAGAGGSASVTCHISWTGALTGEADCSHLDVCHHDFLSIGVTKLASSALPLESIQLIYSPTELILGKFTAMDMDMVNCNAQTSDAGVTYAPVYDASNHLSAGTSMTGTLTDLQFGVDPNDPCTGTAHGSFDAVLPQTTDNAKSLAFHVEF